MTALVTTRRFQTWDDVHTFLVEAPYHQEIVIPKADLPPPNVSGAAKSIGLPVGQNADWRFAPDGACQGMHAQDYGTVWHVHLDVVHPACGVIAHVRADAPKLGAYASAIGLGGVIGGFFRGTKGALMGAGAGFLAALGIDFTSAAIGTKGPVKPPDDGSPPPQIGG